MSSKRLQAVWLSNQIARALTKFEELNFLDPSDVSKLIHIIPKKEETRSGPSFLMNVFSKTIEKISDVNYINYQLSSQDLSIISESDTVASFLAQQPSKGHSKQPKKLQRIWFDVLMLRKGQKLLKTELRIYRDSSLVIDNYKGMKFNLTVSRVETNSENKKLIYVTSTVVEPNFDGWIVLDVTEGFKWWTDHLGLNEGFKITTELLGPSTHPVKPEFLGIVGFDGGEDKHPFAVGYYQGLGENFLEFQGFNVVKRIPRKTVHEFDYEEESYDSKALNILDKHLYEFKRSVCRLRKISVKFKDIGLHFVVAPTKIDINDCMGKCKYPFSEKANATDHAILKIKQSIHGVTRLSKPGCMPIEYQDRTLLYFASESVLISRKFKNVSASECACR